MRYRAHGLTIASSQALHGLVPAPESARPDLIVHFDRFDTSAPSPEARTAWFERRYQPGAGPPDLVASRLDAGRWEFAYADGAAFVVSQDTSTVDVTVPPGLTLDDVTEYLLGPILGAVLRLRGVLCLHASAVAVNGGAVVFAGPAGAGKSTMAAALAQRGLAVLADDTVAVTARGDRWFAAPAFPRLRLWPEAASALDWDVSAESIVMSDGNPRHQIDLLASGRFVDEPTPLAMIYLLEYDPHATRPQIGPVRAASALPVLATHTFAGRVLDRTQREREFHDLVDLLAIVPVRRFTRAPDLRSLGAACATILDDFDV